MIRRPLIALLLAGVAMGGCEDGRGNRLEIWRDGELQQYDHTSVSLRYVDDGLFLVAFASHDPDESVADDELSDRLALRFDAQALLELRTSLEYPIAGQAAWSDVEWNIWLADVTFSPESNHTAAIENLLFSHWCFGCYWPDDVGSQTARGTLVLERNEPDRIEGVLELRIEGDVPGVRDDFSGYDVSLEFNQRPETPDTDAGAVGVREGGALGPC
ncbi:MAG: hypothetical protein PVI24_06055 [Myxococcales bacterium]|jgi:hypothetical protein